MSSPRLRSVLPFASRLAPKDWTAKEEPEKGLPMEGVSLVKVPYLYRHGEYYDAGRRDFNNYQRPLTVKMLAANPATRQTIVEQLGAFRAKGLTTFTDSIDDHTLKQVSVDDPFFQSLSSSPQTRRALLDAGLTEENLQNFAQDHHYVDSAWLRQFLKKKEHQKALNAIRLDTEHLAKYGIGPNELPTNHKDIAKGINMGYGAQLLKALLNYEKTVTYRDEDDREIVVNISKNLKEAILEKHKEAIRIHHGHLGTIGWEESADLIERLEGFGMPPEYKANLPINHLDHKPHVTLKFLRGLQKDHPDVFEKFVALMALQQSTAEQKAMQEGNVSIGHKYSQWFLRVLKIQKPEVYAKVVPILVEHVVKRDMALMEEGKMPIGFNIHHINPLSNGHAEAEMFKMRGPLTEAILHQIETGQPIKSVMNRPSLELINRLGKLGLMGGDKKHIYARGAAPHVGQPLDPKLVAAWNHFVAERFIHPTVRDDDKNIDRDPHKGILDIELDPTQEGVKAFSTADRQFFTKRGMPQHGYIELAKAAIKDGKFDKEAYQKAAAAFVKNLVPSLLAEEKAYQALADQGIVGGNSTGFYLDKSGQYLFDAKRSNFLMANSSAVNPVWNDHSAIHALVAPQLDYSVIGKVQPVYILMPHQPILTAPVDPSVYGMSKDFRRVYTHPEEFSVETYWIPMARIASQYLPKTAVIGGLTAETRINKKSAEYKNGYDVGTFYGWQSIGKTSNEAKAPALLPKYKPDILAGFLKGYDDASNEHLTGLTQKQIDSFLYQSGFYSIKSGHPKRRPEPLQLTPEQASTYNEFKALRKARRSTPSAEIPDLLYGSKTPQQSRS